MNKINVLLFCALINLILYCGILILIFLPSKKEIYMKIASIIFLLFCIILSVAAGASISLLMEGMK